MIVQRLIPGEDIKESLEKIRSENDLRSGIIISMVGSLKQAVFRFSNKEKRIIDGPLEIVSSEGTIATNGLHIHISVSDKNGNVYGGHLLSGSKVYTTCEVAVLETEYTFERIHDYQTGYNELSIQNNDHQL
jgi:predicted DNA-binding protein with PD1-like motif